MTKIYFQWTKWNWKIYSAQKTYMIVRDALVEVAGDTSDQDIYRAASHFLLNGGLLKNPIGSLSEGQK